MQQPGQDHVAMPNPTSKPHVDHELRGYGARHLAFGLLAGLFVALMASPARAADTPPALRVCMDPDNPPFSSIKGTPPGLYVEVAQHIAEALGRPFEPVWTLTYFGKRAVRTTLLDRKCDAFIGLPEMNDFMGPNVLVSHPIVQLGYALVLPKGRTVTTLADLKGMRVAVQFSSPPQSLLAEHDDIQSVTVINTPDAMQALASGAADAAFIWGPTAGFINKTKMNDAYHVVPVAGRNMQWEAAIGFPKGQAALRDQVDAAIDSSAGAITALKEKYGFPAASEQPITLADAAPEAGLVRLAADTTGPAPQPVAPSAAGADRIADGHELFNATCSHCHGPDAVQAQRNVDLRRIKIRHGDQADEVFTYTVHHGKPDKGMPNWTGVVSDEDLEKIKAYLFSIQSS